MLAAMTVSPHAELSGFRTFLLSFPLRRFRLSNHVLTSNSRIRLRFKVISPSRYSTIYEAHFDSYTWATLYPIPLANGAFSEQKK